MTVGIRVSVFSSSIQTLKVIPVEKIICYPTPRPKSEEDEPDESKDADSDAADEPGEADGSSVVSDSEDPQLQESNPRATMGVSEFSSVAEDHQGTSR